ncbi:kinase-like domain-containing protein [Xylaria cf. heliscus]|nr:kinase-like domain-containing protein [Xylaria cf. heliscus]
MLRASERKKLREENIQRLTEEQSNYFTEHHNFEFVRRLGLGSGAVALLFKEVEREAPGPKTRNVVVKFAFSEYEYRNQQADDEIENERKWLTMLQGAEHIVRVLGHEVDRSKVPRPVLVLEYVEYGSIQDLCKRMTVHNVDAPNRVLWSMFLCLIRACIGFAYPPWENGEQETIPADGNKKPSSIIHNDLHDENVLIGELMLDGIEHKHTPILKVIDFGKTAVVPPGNWVTADQTNIQEAARIITGVVARKYSALRDENMEVDIPDEAGNVRKIVVFTDPALRDSTHLLPALKNLLLLCQAANPKDRPSLQHVLSACEDAVTTHNAQSYAGIPNYDSTLESDDDIRSTIQQIVFNADVSS